MEASVWLVLLLALCCSAASGAIPVRLMDGATSDEGRVEFFINNTWWTICSTIWGHSSANVVCRQLGYTVGTGTRSITNGFFGNPPSTRPVILDYYYSCSGTELSIDACPVYRISLSQCPNHGGVVCKSQVYPPMPVRLVDGRISTRGVEGRVEVFSNGTWGTICDDRLDTITARTICLMLGYDSYDSYPLYNTPYGAGSGPILITRLYCESSDRNLTTCLQLNSSIFTCPNSQVAGVFCNYTRSSEDIPVRLDGPSPFEGTVEVFVYGRWSKLCTDDLNPVLAKVLCRQLGWNLSDANVGPRGSYITAFTPFLPRVHMYYYCNGKEHNIGNCTVVYPLGSHSCLNRYEFGVFCYLDQVEAMTTSTIPETTTREVSTETTSKRVDNAETATEKSSSNLPNTGELNVVAVILGATLALSLIVIILILVIFLTRDRLRGASYLADAKRGRDTQEAGQGPARQQVYQNAAFHSQAEAAVSPASAAEQDYHYERLQGRATRQM